MSKYLVHGLMRMHFGELYVLVEQLTMVIAVMR